MDIIATGRRQEHTSGDVVAFAARRAHAARWLQDFGKDTMLTTEQRERYRRDGYIVIPGFKSAGDSVDAFDPATSRGRIVGYVRVSSVGQNTARQLDDIELGRVFEAKCSGGECKAHKFD